MCHFGLKDVFMLLFITAKNIYSKLHVQHLGTGSISGAESIQWDLLLPYKDEDTDEVTQGKFWAGLCQSIVCG